MKKYLAAVLAALLAIAGTVVPVTGRSVVSAETVSDAASLNEALNYPGEALSFVSEGEYPFVVEGDHAKSSNQGVDGVYDQASGEVKPCISGVSTTVTANDGDVVSFDLSVSSERVDRLCFYIDGERINRWSGEVAWTGVCFELTAGTHELLWQYEKDGSASEGEDTARLDNIHVGEPLAVESVELVSAVSVPACRKVQLEWTILPRGAANQTVFFDSSDESVATVDDNGLVRGVKEGTATISVCTEDGSFVDECSVTVTAARPAVQIYGMLAAESLYYSEGSGAYRQPCTWTTFNDVDPETSVEEIGEQFDANGGEAAVAAAEYVDGYVYGFLGYGYYPEEFFRISFEELQSGSFEPEYYGTYASEDGVVLDMAYNYANETMYYIEISMMTGNVSLNTVDLATGESAYIAEITNDDATLNTNTYYSIAISTDGVGYVMLSGMGAIGYGQGMLCEIDLATAHVTRNVCLGGGECYQQQSMTYDHNTGLIYWAQWSNPYGPGNSLRSIDPATGETEYLGVINGDGGCEILGMFIPYDGSEPEPTPVPPTEEPTDIPTDTPTDVPTDVPTDMPTDAPTDVPSGEPATPAPTTPPAPATGALSVAAFGLAAIAAGTGAVLFGKRRDEE